MAKSKITEDSLASLESSLTAIEHDLNSSESRLNPFHLKWVYYYLSLLGLIWILGVFVAVKSTMTSDQTSYLVLTEDHVPSASGKTEVEVTATNSAEIESSSAAGQIKSSRPSEYHFYTPEELQKIADKISGNSSRELNIVKAEVYSFLGWYGDIAKLKKEGSDFANLCIQDDAQDPRNQRALALSHTANGQYERARVILSGLHPEGNDSLKEWLDAYLLLAGGKPQSATTKFDQIRKADPSFYPASYMLIQQYLKLNLVSKANDIAQFWKSKGLTNIQFVRLMTEILYRQDQYVELAYYLNQLESVYPKDWTVLYYSGISNEKIQKKDLAKTYFKKILSAQENFNVDQIGKAYFEMGKIMLLENNYKGSIENLFEASQRIPEDPNVRLNLANAYFKSEDYEKSIDIYQQMLVKDQNDPKIRTYLGMAYFELGQYQSAEKNLELAMNQGSNDPVLLYYLAQVEEQKGDMNKTKDYLKKLLTIDPKYPQALQMLEKINPVAPAASATPTEAQ